MQFLLLVASLLAVNNSIFASDIFKDRGSSSRSAEDEVAIQPELLVAKVNEHGLVEVEDMVLTPEMFRILYPLVDGSENKKNITVHRRAAVANRNQLWPGARIPYTFGPLAGNAQVVLNAMSEWMRVTCVRFFPRTAQDRFWVEIRTPGAGCTADVGFQNRVTNINLGSECFTHGVVLHEIGHALGLIHEHQHPDRDRFLTIYWQNIQPAMQQWFRVDTTSSTWGIGYDPNSIMHYINTAFSYPGCVGANCITMASRIGAAFGQQQYLSPNSDIPIVNKMYCSGGK